jgi:hypothetical protein
MAKRERGRPPKADRRLLFYAVRDALKADRRLQIRGAVYGVATKFGISKDTVRRQVLAEFIVWWASFARMRAKLLRAGLWRDQ